MASPEVVEARFWARVDRQGDDCCWLWTGARNTGKVQYGRIEAENGRMRAHRWAYERFVGPIPDGLVIDHLCRVTLCVNPLHLEPVTPAENNRRGNSPSAVKARQTHCAKGHPFDALNTTRDARGKRRCRICRRQIERAKKRRQRSRPHSVAWVALVAHLPPSP